MPAPDSLGSAGSTGRALSGSEDIGAPRPARCTRGTLSAGGAAAALGSLAAGLTAVLESMVASRGREPRRGAVSAGAAGRSLGAAGSAAAVTGRGATSVAAEGATATGVLGCGGVGTADATKRCSTGVG
jgi:hypothetical protein